jgi:hypothetical protein
MARLDNAAKFDQSKIILESQRNSDSHDSDRTELANQMRIDLALVGIL